MKVGIVGGAGAFGGGIGVRIAHAGHAVTLGARDSPRASEVATELTKVWQISTGSQTARLVSGCLRGDSLESAASADLVIMSLPASDFVDVARELAPLLVNKTVISPVNKLKSVNGELVADVIGGQSSAELLQAALPQSRVAAAFNHVPAKVARDPNGSLSADVLICATDADALNETRALVASIEGLRPVHAGSLAVASVVEAFTAVIINVDHLEHRHASIRLTEQG